MARERDEGKGGGRGRGGEGGERDNEGARDERTGEDGTRRRGRGEGETARRGNRRMRGRELTLAHRTDCGGVLLQGIGVVDACMRGRRRERVVWTSPHFEERSEGVKRAPE